jgi:hypothetical protein
VRQCLLILVGLVAGAAPAWAGDGESVATAGLGWGSYATPSEEKPEEDVSPDAGAVLTLSYDRGIGDALAWRVALAGGGYVGGGTSGTAALTAGLVYRFDVLKYVPYGVGAAGVLVTGGGPLPTDVVPVIELGGGLDVLRDRSLSYGLEVRVASWLGTTTTVTAGVRVSWHWGFF